MKDDHGNELKDCVNCESLRSQLAACQRELEEARELMHAHIKDELEAEQQLAQMKEAFKTLDSQLLQVAVEFARGTFLLNLEGCRTINDARLLDAHCEHQCKALQLKKQLDAVRTLTEKGE